MIALSVKQPWPNLIAAGYKTIETRIWSTKYRGELLICASKKADVFAGISALAVYEITSQPTGQAICVVDLVDCRPMIDSDVDAACCPVYDRAVAWIFENVRLIKPFPVKGKLGLFNAYGPIEVIE